MSISPLFRWPNSVCHFSHFSVRIPAETVECAERVSRTYVQMRPVFAFFCPVSALLLVCRQCEHCGCSSHSCIGHHLAEPSTGSTHQSSWRVIPSSVRHPDGQRFHSDGTAADIRSIFPLTCRKPPGVPRYRVLSDSSLSALPPPIRFGVASFALATSLISSLSGSDEGDICAKQYSRCCNNYSRSSSVYLEYPITTSQHADALRQRPEASSWRAMIFSTTFGLIIFSLKN